MGSHKPALAVGGRPVVARVLDAVGARPVLVVGRPDGVPAGVRVLTEDPPGGGPVAGIAAGLAALTNSPYAAELASSAAAVILVLAGDLPLLTSGHLAALAAAASKTGRVAVTVGPSGANWLCAAWPATLLRDRLEALGETSGASVRRLLADCPKVEVADPAEVALDVDTPADLDAVRARLDAGD